MLTNTRQLGIKRARFVLDRGFVSEDNLGYMQEKGYFYLRIHLNKTTDGKVFVGFLALILRCYLMKKVKGNKDTKSLTLEKVLLELRKIKTVTLADLSKVIMPLTKLQKIILSAIDVPAEGMENAYGCIL
jgi:transposase